MLNILMVVAALQVAQQEPVAAVDLYGVRTVSEAAVRTAIGVTPGMTPQPATDSIRARVLAIPGVLEVDVSPVCCDDTGGVLLYVGIREATTPPIPRRAAPTGSARLPAYILEIGDALDPAWMAAVRRGAVEEDHTQGYALAQDATLRRMQEQLVGIASANLDTLIAVLRDSGDARHRALAATVIAYAPDREQVARQLVVAARDDDETVRNNALRALGILVEWANQHPEADVVVPADGFIDLLESVAWTDRNKATFLLLSLTANRPPAVLDALRKRVIPALIEMARWTYPGHALAPFLLLTRVLGVPDDEAFAAWQAGEREELIGRAVDGLAR
jgi:hypothetical protein